MPRFAAEQISEGRRFNIQAYEKEIRGYMSSRVKPEIRKRFEKVVANWDHRPEFRVRLVAGTSPTFATGYGIAVDVWAAGEHADLFRLVSEGARPHMIPEQPKTGDDYLWFRTQYDSKTKLVGGGLSTGGSGTYSGPLVRKRQVSHPGFEGRRFTYHIRQEYRPRWERHVKGILNQAMRAAKRAR